jgi:hypothetical protein
LKRAAMIFQPKKYGWYNLALWKFAEPVLLRSSYTALAFHQLSPQTCATAEKGEQKVPCPGSVTHKFMSCILL